MIDLLSESIFILTECYLYSAKRRGRPPGPGKENKSKKKSKKTQDTQEDVGTVLDAPRECFHAWYNHFDHSYKDPISVGYPS